MIMIMIMTLRRSLIRLTKRCRGVTSTSFVQQSVCVGMKDSRCQNSPTSIIIPFFLYIQHNKLPSKRQTVTGRRCQSNLPQRPFVGNRVMPLFIAGIVSSAIRDPRCRQLDSGWSLCFVLGVDAWKTGVENTQLKSTEYHYIKTWWIFFGGVGWRGGNMKLGSCPCQLSILSCVSLVLSIYTMYFRDTGACLTFASCWDTVAYGFW